MKRARSEEVDVQGKKLKEDKTPCVGLKNSCDGSILMPQLGFGTYTLKKERVETPLSLALDAGYNLIDTAWVYENEKNIGNVLTNRRKDNLRIPFITTKLWRSHQGGEEVIRKYLNQSLKKLGAETIDLWLLHWPGPGQHRFKRYEVPKGWTPATRIQTWKAILKILSEGKKVRSVGVSNFTIRHLEELKRETGVLPSVNQVEMHPFLVQSELLEYCKKEGITVTAYCSLGEGDKKLLNEPTIVSVAKKLHKSTAQVLLRWGIQKGMVVIPCSTSQEHIVENMDVFEWHISEEDMREIDKLDKKKRYGWKGVDPETVL